MTGCVKDNGPQLIFTQLLPSSTVAPAVRLKTGAGTLASFVPGILIYHRGSRLRRNSRTVAVLLGQRRIGLQVLSRITRTAAWRIEFCGASVNPEL